MALSEAFVAARGVSAGSKGLTFVNAVFNEGLIFAGINGISYTLLSGEDFSGLGLFLSTTEGFKTGVAFGGVFGGLAKGSSAILNGGKGIAEGTSKAIGITGRFATPIKHGLTWGTVNTVRGTVVDALDGQEQSWGSWLQRRGGDFLIGATVGALVPGLAMRPLVNKFGLNASYKILSGAGVTGVGYLADTLAKDSILGDLGIAKGREFTWGGLIVNSMFGAGMGYTVAAAPRWARSILAPVEKAATPGGNPVLWQKMSKVKGLKKIGNFRKTLQHASFTEAMGVHITMATSASVLGGAGGLGLYYMDQDVNGEAKHEWYEYVAAGALIGGGTSLWRTAGSKWLNKKLGLGKETVSLHSFAENPNLMWRYSLVGAVDFEIGRAHV